MIYENENAIPQWDCGRSPILLIFEYIRPPFGTRLSPSALFPYHHQLLLRSPVDHIHVMKLLPPLLPTDGAPAGPHAMTAVAAAAAAAAAPVSVPYPIALRQLEESPSPSDSLSSKTNRTTIVVVVVAAIILTGVVVLWRVYWWYRYRTQQRRQRDDAALLAAARRAAAVRAAAEQSAAAEARAEQALETFDAASVATDSMCAVCLERLDVSCGDVLAAPCMHVLHAHCWRGWLAKDPSRACPICRASVLVDDHDDDDDDDDDVDEVDVEGDTDAHGRMVDAYQGSSAGQDVHAAEELDEREVSVSDADGIPPSSRSSGQTTTVLPPHLKVQNSGPTEMNKHQATSAGSAAMSGPQPGTTGGSQEDGSIGSAAAAVDTSALDGPRSGSRSGYRSFRRRAVHDASGATSHPSLSAPQDQQSSTLIPRATPRIPPFSVDNLFSNVRHLSLLSRTGGGAEVSNFELGDDGDSIVGSGVDDTLSYTVDARGRRRQLSLILVTSGPTTNSVQDVTVRRRLLAASAELNRLWSSDDGLPSTGRDDSNRNRADTRWRSAGNVGAGTTATLPTAPARIGTLRMRRTGGGKEPGEPETVMGINSDVNIDMDSAGIDTGSTGPSTVPLQRFE